MFYHFFFLEFNLMNKMAKLLFFQMKKVRLHLNTIIFKIIEFRVIQYASYKRPPLEGNLDVCTNLKSNFL